MKINTAFGLLLFGLYTSTVPAHAIPLTPHVSAGVTSGVSNEYPCIFRPFIDRIAVNGEHFSAGDTVRVDAFGSAGGSAILDIQGLANGLPMQEVAPGHYQATCVVPADASVRDGRAIVHLTLPGSTTAVSRSHVHLNVAAGTRPHTGIATSH